MHAEGRQFRIYEVNVNKYLVVLLNGEYLHTIHTACIRIWRILFH